LNNEQCDYVGFTTFSNAFLMETPMMKGAILNNSSLQYTIG